ncbi:TPA: acetyl-coenzyme A synthetase, partial [Candidatus Poribacteria bacterium]|nr:acetyl-coenzyme A synthetase [Candidatus Poribacteria bacterium]
MEETRRFPPTLELSQKAHIKSMEQYQQMYDESINEPDKFWLREAEIIDWYQKPTKAREYTWDTAKRRVEIKWFEDGELNASYNCLDRHLNTWRKNKAAIIWQGEPEEDNRILTYQELHREVCKFSNVLKSKGVKKGDRVALYLPM